MHTHTRWTNCSMSEMAVTATINGGEFLEWTFKFLILKSYTANS